jgi:hypothetical protein
METIMSLGAAAVEPVAMICEGTRVDKTEADSEERVKEVAKKRTGCRKSSR